MGNPFLAYHILKERRGTAMLPGMSVEDAIRANEKLVGYVINRSFRQYCDDEDVYQMGLIGLWRAIEMFDASKGAKFSTYAIPSIYNNILRELNPRLRQPESVSMSEPMPGQQGEERLTVESTVLDPRDPIGDVEARLALEEARKKHSDRDWGIFLRFLSGERQGIIGADYGIGRAAVSRVVRDCEFDVAHALGIPENKNLHSITKRRNREFWR